jgi:hypothetical protein
VNAVEDVRRRVQLALSGGPACPNCGVRDPKPVTARELARRIGIKPGVIRRFAKGGDIYASNLALLDVQTQTLSDDWPSLNEVMRQAEAALEQRESEATDG